MRIKLFFNLEKPELDIQYRKSLVSFIKHALEEYDENLYKELYKKGENKMKSFTFAPLLPEPKFRNEIIDLSQNYFQVVFSFYNYAHALHFYNSFVKQKNKKFSLYQNSITLNKILILSEKEITSNVIYIKMESPLIVRNHDRETLKDMYYSFEKKEEFEKYLKINIKEQMKNENLDESLLDEFKIEAVQPKKAIVKVYEYKIESSLGTFKLTGNKKLLKYLYQSGLGTKKGLGFGLFEII